MGRLFWKFLFVFWLAQLTTAAGVGALIWLKDRDREAEWRAANDQTPLLLKSSAATLQHGGPKAFIELMHNTGTNHQPIFAIDENGQELLGRLPPDFRFDDLPPPMRDGINQNSIPNIKAADGHTYRVIAWPNPNFEGQAHMPPPPFERGKHRHHPPRPEFGRHSPLFLPLISGMIASLIFSTLLAWYFSKPIRSLRNAFQEAATGNLSVRLGPSMGKRRDELADLGHHFDQMAEKIEQLMQAQRRLLHDVSHELRSPLARLQAIVGLLRQQPERINDGAMLERIEKESDRIDSLVNELLTLARLEAGMIQNTQDEFEINELISQIVDDASIEAQTRGIHLLFQPIQALPLKGNPELIHSAIENIVRNAIKYSPADNEVVIEIQRNPSENSIQIKVTDYGPGVPASEISKIFEPFYRSQSSANGHGLGLAIARSVIHAHGGSISASNIDEGGFCVMVVLRV